MIEVMKLTQYLLLMFFWARKGVLNILHLPWTLLVFELRLGTSETVLLRVSPSYRKCPSVRLTIAANSACSDFDVIRRQSATLSQM
jgi:hypothetical protein